MKASRVLLFVMLCLLTACSKDQSNQVEQTLAFLEVDVTISPEQAKVGENVIFEATVTYGDEPVVDAESVVFEIGQTNTGKTEEFHVEHYQDGIYRLERSFLEEGTYFIYAHVTAEGLHNMPKKEFIIGKPNEVEVIE